MALTANRIHSLIAGNFYAAVDFGDGNCLGNLAPAYGFANGPTAGAIIITPPIGGNNQWDFTVISPNNRNATIVADGSGTTDPFYLPMQFLWTAREGFSGGPPTTVVFTSTNTITTNLVNVGSCVISLQASDAIATGPPFDFNMQVITAGQAVSTLISAVQFSGIPGGKQQTLTAALSMAAHLFNHGHMAAGCGQLSYYLRLVKAAHLDAVTASHLSQPALDIINACEPPNHGFGSRPRSTRTG